MYLLYALYVETMVEKAMTPRTTLTQTAATFCGRVHWLDASSRGSSSRRAATAQRPRSFLTEKEPVTFGSLRNASMIFEILRRFFDICMYKELVWILLLRKWIISETCRVAHPCND